jgi:transcriptional regulator with XRE-family HTH domain
MREIIHQEIRDRLKQLRADEGLTQKEFAQSINTSFRAIQSYEFGTSLPGSKVLLGLAKKTNQYQLAIDRRRQ